MGKIIKLLPILLVALMVASCYSLISGATEKKASYDQYIKLANIAKDKEISIDVDDAYSNALDLNNNINDYLDWANYYVNLDDYSSAVNIAEDAVDNFPKNANTYNLLMNCYLQLQDYKGFFEAYNKCKAKGSVNDAVQKLYSDNKYVFELKMESYSDAFSFSNGYARTVKYDHADYEHKTPLYGYVSLSDSIRAQYTYAGDFNSDEVSVAPVNDINGNSYYINTNGDKKYVVSPEKINVVQLGYYASGVLSVFDGSKYYLCDINSEVIAGPFDYVSTINGNIGVIKEGNAWKIINNKGEQIVDKTYDDVKLDSKSIAYRGGMFVKSGDLYYLIDEKGNNISDQGFEDACLFVDELAAVKKDGKWGFINRKGEQVIDYQYHEAKSFSGGFAPVKLNGKWGYITLEKDKERLAIDYQFEDALGFDSTGKIAFVKQGNEWKILKLYL